MNAYGVLLSPRLAIEDAVSLREKCPYSALFWIVFSRLRTEYGILRVQSECGIYGPE